MPYAYHIFVGICLVQICLASHLSCKTMPQDPDWPDTSTWSRFNASVDGRLIRTVPIASVCHGSNYDGAKCDVVRDKWHSSQFHAEYASSITAPIFLNKSCDPFTDVDDQCTVGAYVEYSVDVATPDHIIRTLSFAKKHNIRFVVKNTGHDYMGKSTGAGGLAIWTHHLTDREWIPQYTSEVYSGPAVKVQAGVTGGVLVQDAEARGLAVVAGQCPTVGYAGGYIQGGGHSVLSSLYGMAADQTLEFEVITTDGRFIRASPSENSDLYWALSGGGGGTYGIVWSATVKAYPNMPVTSLLVSFEPGQSSDKSTLDMHWEGIASFMTAAPEYLDTGAYYVNFVGNTFFYALILFPKKTPEQVTTLTQPWLDQLQTLNITPAIAQTIQHPTVRDATAVVSQLSGGEILTGTDLAGARILPRRLWETEKSLSTLFTALRGIADDGGRFINVGIKPTLEVAGNPNNAVFPPFRTMHSMCIALWGWNDTASWEEGFAGTKIATALADRLAEIAPETGAYLNEANAFDPNWKQNFYGVNYDKLLQIKDRWDPDQMLYGTTAVGGDRWVTVEGGRLCPLHESKSSFVPPREEL